eukprot:1152346-Pelagomonas_calceolata.AAC.7
MTCAPVTFLDTDPELIMTCAPVTFLYTDAGLVMTCTPVAFLYTDPELVMTCTLAFLSFLRKKSPPPLASSFYLALLPNDL